MTKINLSLKLASVIAIFLVITIHYNTIEISENWYNLLIQNIIVDGFARGAVPTFSFISGFFFFKNYNNTKISYLSYYINILKKKWKSLIIPYLIASFIFLFFFYIKDKNFLLFNFSDFLYYWLISPRSAQMWFIRDLIVIAVISPIFIIRINIFCYYLILFVFSILWIINIQITPKIGGWNILNIEMIFFFCTGIMIQKHNILQKLYFKRNTIILLAITFFILNIIRFQTQPYIDIYHDNEYSLQIIILYKTIILTSILLILNISIFLVNKVTLFISQFIFFVYLYHLFPLRYVILKICNFSGEYSIYLSSILVFVVTIIIALLLKNIFPKVYKLISGDR